MQKHKQSLRERPTSFALPDELLEAVLRLLP